MGINTLPALQGQRWRTVGVKTGLTFPLSPLSLPSPSGGASLAPAGGFGFGFWMEPWNFSNNDSQIAACTTCLSCFHPPELYQGFGGAELARAVRHIWTASRDADLAQPQSAAGSCPGGWEKPHKFLLHGLLPGSARLLGACLQREGSAAGSEVSQMCGDGAAGLHRSCSVALQIVSEPSRTSWP